jgi:hypothetical protein
MGVITAMAVGAAASLAGGAIAGGAAGKAARRARGDKQRAEAELESIKNSRQQITNPYASTEDLSGLATDLSSQLSNPFENLGVATKAAEIQIEQADISLANTLDTLRATGASAGGATALAQAALQSKQGVAASIEQQEAQNEKLRAQGEQNLMNAKMSEQQRMQNIAISEGQRLQATDAAGKQFMFQAEENRTNMDLDRAAGQISQAQAAEASANQAKAQAWSSAIGGVGSIVSAGIGAGAFSGSAANPTPPDMTGMIYRSDRRLKKHIKIIGRSKSGLNIYSFEYIDKSFSKEKWQGVMSDDVPQYAVVKNFLGMYDGVDYSKIDVEFKQI